MRKYKNFAAFSALPDIGATQNLLDSLANSSSSVEEFLRLREQLDPMGVFTERVGALSDSFNNDLLRAISPYHAGKAFGKKLEVLNTQGMSNGLPDVTGAIKQGIRSIPDTLSDAGTSLKNTLDTVGNEGRKIAENIDAIRQRLPIPDSLQAPDSPKRVLPSSLEMPGQVRRLLPKNLEMPGIPKRVSAAFDPDREFEYISPLRRNISSAVAQIQPSLIPNFRNTKNLVVQKKDSNFSWKGQLFDQIAQNLDLPNVRLPKPETVSRSVRTALENYQDNFDGFGDKGIDRVVRKTAPVVHHIPKKSGKILSTGVKGIGGAANMQIRKLKAMTDADVLKQTMLSKEALSAYNPKPKAPLKELISNKYNQL